MNQKTFEKNDNLIGTEREKINTLIKRILPGKKLAENIDVEKDNEFITITFSVQKNDGRRRYRKIKLSNKFLQNAEEILPGFEDSKPIDKKRIPETIEDKKSIIEISYPLTINKLKDLLQTNFLTNTSTTNNVIKTRDNQLKREFHA